MIKQNFVALESTCYVVMAPILYFYIILIYGENSEPWFLPIVVFIVLPVISSCSAAFIYEKNIGFFIPIHELIKSCFLLLVSHILINSIILFLLTDREIEAALFVESMKISFMQLLLILLPVLLLGKTINKILLDWKK